MKISPSLFSTKADIYEYAQKLDYIGADLIHIDYLEGVKERCKVEELNTNLSKTPFDVHIINSSFSKEYAQSFNNTSTRYISVQYENLNDKDDIYNLQYFHNKKSIAITYETPLEDVEKYFHIIDYILIMCSQPGVSGAKFNEKNLERIEYLRKNFPHIPIHVDGGLNIDKVRKLKTLGVSVCVLGSYFLAEDNIELINKMVSLYSSNIDIKVETVMLNQKYLPLCKESDDLITILENIDKSKTGTIFVEDNVKRYRGIITDGDIRRALIKHKSSAFCLKAEDLMNSNCYYAEPEYSLRKILFDRIILSKAISVIPVIKNDSCIGFIDLNEYIY